MKLRFSRFLLEAGCDEAGRGCLAGPVVAASVILPDDFDCPELNDSKLLKPAVRERLRTIIEETAISWSVAIVDHLEIDRINILQASIQAMHHSINQLNIKPDFLAIDGNYFRTYAGIEHVCCIKGDATFMNIAAASILAKTHRDEIMCSLHENYPYYRWQQNKGYPTTQHRLAIREYGISPFHRKSFRLFQNSELFS